MKRQTTIRFSEATEQKLQQLAERYGTITEAIAVAVDRLYQEEIMREREITVSSNSRQFGWGYSTTPAGTGPYDIEHPAGPEHVGTLGQIAAAREADRTYAAIISGGTFHNDAWFYNGRRITHTYGLTAWSVEEPTAADPDAHRWETGARWVHGFDPELAAGGKIRIRLAD